MCTIFLVQSLPNYDFKAVVSAISHDLVAHLYDNDNLRNKEIWGFDFLVLDMTLNDILSFRCWYTCITILFIMRYFTSKIHICRHMNYCIA